MAKNGKEKKNGQLTVGSNAGLPVAWENIQPGDEDMYDSTPSSSVWARIRQKDLKSEDGKETLFPAGGFMFTADDERPDQEQLFGAIIGVKNGRVYYPESAGAGDKPTCKSSDMIYGSRPREIVEGFPCYGVCNDCALGQFKLSGGSPDCDATVNLLFVELDDRQNMKDEFIAAFTKSALQKFKENGRILYRTWPVHDQAILKAARKANPDIEIKHAPHHLVLVAIKTQFIRAEKGTYYVPVFEELGGVSEEAAVRLREERNKMRAMFVREHESQDPTKADIRGVESVEDVSFP